MKNRKHIAIAIVTAVLTIGGLTFAKAKMYRHHYEHATGLSERGHQKGAHCWNYSKDSKQPEDEK